MWLYLTLLSVFISSFANILQRILMKDEKSDPVVYAMVFHLLLGMCNLIFALMHGFVLPQVNSTLFLYVLAALLWGGGTVFLFRALKSVEATEVTIIGTFKSVVTILFSVIFLGEIFNLQKIIGTIILLCAVYLASQVKSGLRFHKGIGFIFVMALCYGSAQVVDAFIVKTYEPISYLAISNLLIGILLVMFNLGKVALLPTTLKPHFLKRMLPLVLLSSLQAIAFYVALSIGGHVSQMGTINQAQVILTVLLAVILLNEKDHLLRKVLAGTLATIGIVLLG